MWNLDTTHELRSSLFKVFEDYVNVLQMRCTRVVVLQRLLVYTLYKYRQAGDSCFCLAASIKKNVFNLHVVKFAI